MELRRGGSVTIGWSAAGCPERLASHSVGVTLGLDNGKENGSYRDYRGYTGYVGDILG